MVLVNNGEDTPSQTTTRCLDPAEALVDIIHVNVPDSGLRPSMLGSERTLPREGGSVLQRLASHPSRAARVPNFDLPFGLWLWTGSKRIRLPAKSYVFVGRNTKAAMGLDSLDVFLT